MNALTIHKLYKTYKNGPQALKGIDLEVQKGDFFALLGPNGAGKSTAIGIIASLVNKTSGKVHIFDYDLEAEPLRARSLIGLVPQEFNFNIFENVGDIVVNQAGYYGLPRKQAKKNAEFYLRKLGLWNKVDSPARALSGGMKRRLMIARGLVHQPKLLILDEPTAGVDLELRRSMWTFLQEINEKGITIILTTHYLEEAENLCRNIAIINNGEIIENTSTKALLSKLNTEQIILDLENPLSKPLEIPRFNVVKLDDMTLEVSFFRKTPLNDLFKYLSKENCKVLSMRNKTNRLEELFLGLVHSEESL